MAKRQAGRRLLGFKHDFLALDEFARTKLHEVDICTHLPALIVAAIPNSNSVTNKVGLIDDRHGHVVRRHRKCECQFGRPLLSRSECERYCASDLRTPTVGVGMPRHGHRQFRETGELLRR